MTKVKFLQDFQGVETKNVFYLKDQVVELDDETSSRVVKDGRAEYVVGHGTASFENTPQFEESPAFEPLPEEQPEAVMTSKHFKRGRK